MSDLSDLYQEVILDHNRRPRNFGPLADANRVAQGHNPLCGDRLTLYVKLDGDRIDRHLVRRIGLRDLEGVGVAHDRRGQGPDARRGARRCSTASTACSRRPIDQPVDDERLGKLAVFAGVREFPVRVKCASLAWHTLKAALAGSHQPVKTE